MSPKKAHSPGVSPFAVLLALGLAGAAQAASYTVRPEIDVEQTHDDNVLSEEDELSSWVTRIAPTLNLTRKSDTSDLGLRAGIAHRNYYSVSELDGTDKYLSGIVRRDLTRRLSLGLHGNYEFYAAYNAIEQVQPNGNQQVLFDERPDFTWSGLGGNLTYKLDDSTELTGDVDWNDYSYSQSDRLDLYDNDDRSVSLTLTRQLTPLDEVGTSVGYSVSEEDPSETRSFFPEFHSHDELGTLLAFWQRAWSPRWSTALRAGVRTLDTELKTDRAYLLGPLAPFCGPVLPIGSPNCPLSTKSSNSGNGFVGGGSITHAYSDRGQITLSYSRDTQTGTASTTGSSAADTDRYSVSVTHRLLPRLSLSLSGTYLAYASTDEALQLNDLGQQVRINSEANTRLHMASLRLDWQLRKNMIAYVRFNYSDSNQERPLSRAPDNEYNRRIYGLGIRYFFDQEL